MYYDDWKTNHPDDCECDPYEGYVHIEELRKYDSASDWIKEVIHHVYATGDINMLEGALEELGSIFDICLPSTSPKVQKKNRELFDFSVQLIQDQVTKHSHITV